MAITNPEPEKLPNHIPLGVRAHPKSPRGLREAEMKRSRSEILAPSEEVIGERVAVEVPALVTNDNLHPPESEGILELFGPDQIEDCILEFKLPPRYQLQHIDGTTFVYKEGWEMGKPPGYAFLSLKTGEISDARLDNTSSNRFAWASRESLQGIITQKIKEKSNTNDIKLYGPHYPSDIIGAFPLSEKDIAQTGYRTLFVSFVPTADGDSVMLEIATRHLSNRKIGEGRSSSFEPITEHIIIKGKNVAKAIEERFRKDPESAAKVFMHFLNQTEKNYVSDSTFQVPTEVMVPILRPRKIKLWGIEAQENPEDIEIQSNAQLIDEAELRRLAVTWELSQEKVDKVSGKKYDTSSPEFPANFDKTLIPLTFYPESNEITTLKNIDSLYTKHLHSLRSIMMIDHDHLRFKRPEDYVILLRNKNEESQLLLDRSEINLKVNSEQIEIYRRKDLSVVSDEGFKEFETTDLVPFFILSKKRSWRLHVRDTYKL